MKLTAKSSRFLVEDTFIEIVMVAGLDLSEISNDLLGPTCVFHNFLSCSDTVSLSSWLQNGVVSNLKDTGFVASGVGVLFKLDLFIWGMLQIGCELLIKRFLFLKLCG